MELDSEILRRYSEGKCSVTEVEKVEQWLKQGAPSEEYKLPDYIDRETEEKRMRKALFEKIQESTQSSIRKKNRLSSSVKALMAAAVVIIFLCCYYVAPEYSNFFAEETEQPVYREVSVPYGQKITLILSDSTTVHLNSGSTFRFPERFMEKERMVELHGEGFFRVAKDPEHPFLVRTSRTRTKVLGTEFNLRDFEEEKNSEITVNHGKVAFSGIDTTQVLFLEKYDHAVLLGNDTLYEEKVKDDNVTEWMDGVLRFDNLLLEEAVPVIERWYGIRMTVKNPELEKVRIKGRFPKQTLHAFMDNLSYLLNVSYDIRQKEVFVYL